MREHLKAYFTFSRKERMGIAILLVIVVSVAVGPAFISGDQPVTDSATLAKYQAFFVALEKKEIDNGSKSQQPRYGATVSQTTGASGLTPFMFDPNTIGIDGWKRLGIREKTAVSIAKYIEKGGRFRKPEDINKIYGLSDQEKNVLLPFVSIAASEPSREVVNRPPFGRSPFGQGSGDSGNYRAKGHTEFRLPAKAAPVPIDVNRADTNLWRSLPGIGPVLSKRIVMFRDKLGGFYSCDQVSEVYGLPDSTFQRIKPFLLCDGNVTKVNLNEATQATLEQHPYFRRNVARAIVDYRSQHGAFKDVNELRQLVAISKELFDRLLPYTAL